MGKRNRRHKMQAIQQGKNVVALHPIEPKFVQPDLIGVRRSFDAVDINPILNDPSVFSLIAVPGIETFNFTALVNDPNNVLLATEGGAIFFHQRAIGIYEVHTNFLPKYRGRYAIRASLAAYRWMFTRTNCMVLLTRVPAFNKAAAWFCRIVGATEIFTRHAMWPTDHGPVDVSFWSMTYDEWVRKTPSLMESGKRFHKRLDEEFARHGAVRAPHADEDCHDLYVGVCAETVYGGQPEKAVILYNAWASFAEYGTINLVARSPLILDIGDAVLQVGENDFRVIKCR